MLEQSNNAELPVIPSKRYFTIGEVGELCLVKPHVLRYWEQEFEQLKSITRRANRRYYQRDDILVIRRIRELLHIQGFTIGGARKYLQNDQPSEAEQKYTALINEIIKELEEVIQTLKN